MNENQKRYLKINDSLEEKISFNNNKINYGDTEINLINESIPNFIDKELDNLTSKMSEFYNDVKFPNYDDCEDYASLYEKGYKNLFSRRIENELNYGSKVLELGCGTGQLSLFLSKGNREIYGVDISNGSLMLGEKFRRENKIDNAYFMKMDVFDLKFKKNYFDYTISNGVLHHTKDARKAFKNLVEVTKPGGIIIIGLYHKYGRFFTKVKQKIAKVIGKYVFLLDKVSFKIKSPDKRKAWVVDQFLNPHETIHLPSETLNWFEEESVDFLNLIPHTDNIDKPIFQKHNLPKLSILKEILLMFNKTQIQEGGFFVIIGKKK